MLRIKPTVKPTVKTTLKPNKYLKFAETLNGRVAMQGVVWSTLTEKMLGESLRQQITDPHCLMLGVAVSGTVLAGSYFTRNNIDEEEYFAFTPSTERLNSRLAMIGMLGALAINI
jgi:hypothetical protein